GDTMLCIGRDHFTIMERPTGEVNPRLSKLNPRTRHGERGIRLDLVRTRADGWLSIESDRNRTDHCPRDPRRAGQDPRPIYESDCRAGRLRGGRHRGGERYPESYRSQPAHGAGAGAPLRVQAKEPGERTNTRLR